MAELQLSPKINCFAGNNGVGKTNLLDAVYYLSFCKSAFNALDSQIIRHDADGFQLQGTYVMPDSSKSSISCNAKAKGRKQIKRDKKEYQRFSEHIGYIPLVMVSPSDTQLIIGGSEERRKFIDEIGRAHV